jgi:alpha-tubulin suppressor-like RCC1 family protein
MSTTVDLSANGTDGFTIQQLYLRTKVLYPGSEADISFAGIAISSLDATNGTWQYKLSGGSFTAFPAVTDTTAILLNFASSIRFVANSGYTGSPTFAFVGWNGSGSVGGTADITDANDLRFTFEVYEMQLIQTDITLANTSPQILNYNQINAPYVFNNVDNTLYNNGITVQSIITQLGSNYYDPDTSTLKGIAITKVFDVSGLAGNLQYKTNGSSVWVDISSATTENTSAIPLQPTTYVRFKPSGGYAGNFSVWFIGWDQTSGTEGTPVNATYIQGGAFSQSTAYLNFNVIYNSTYYPILSDASNNVIVPSAATLAIGATYKFKTTQYVGSLRAFKTSSQFSQHIYNAETYNITPISHTTEVDASGLTFYYTTFVLPTTINFYSIPTFYFNLYSDSNYTIQITNGSYTMNNLTITHAPFVYYPELPITGSYNVGGKRRAYLGPTTSYGIQGTITIPDSKKLSKKGANTYSLQYADMGTTYNIVYDASSGALTVTPGSNFSSSVGTANHQFTVITATWNPIARTFYLVTSYKNGAGNIRVVEEVVQYNMDSIAPAYNTLYVGSTYRLSGTTVADSVTFTDGTNSITITPSTAQFINDGTGYYLQYITVPSNFPTGAGKNITISTYASSTLIQTYSFNNVLISQQNNEVFYFDGNWNNYSLRVITRYSSVTNFTIRITAPDSIQSSYISNDNTEGKNGYIYYTVDALTAGMYTVDIIDNYTNTTVYTTNKYVAQYGQYNDAIPQAVVDSAMADLVDYEMFDNAGNVISNGSNITVQAGELVFVQYIGFIQDITFNISGSSYIKTIPALTASYENNSNIFAFYIPSDFPTVQNQAITITTSAMYYYTSQLQIIQNTYNVSSNNVSPQLLTPNVVAYSYSPTGANNGATIASIITSLGANYNDANSINNPGFAITSAPTTDGTWSYKLSGETSWIDMSGLNTVSALLLDRGASIKFTGNNGYAGTTALVAAAWDGTTGTVGSKVDASYVLYGAFSSSTINIQVTVIQGNNAPVLNTGSYILGTTPEDVTDFSGVSIGYFLNSIIGSGITDSDNNALRGIAITDICSNGGTWSFKDVSSGFFSTYSGISTTNAILLSPDSYARFIPNSNFNGTARFTFKAWDQYNGSVGVTVDTTNNTYTSFSTASAEAIYTVTAVNDSPVINTQTIYTSPIPVNGDIKFIPTFTVESLINQMTGYSDVDPNAQKGIAIVLNNSWITSDGMEFLLQYQLSGETGWTDISSSASVNNALLLTPSAKIRAFPRVNFIRGNSSYCIDIRIWDQATGTEGQYANANYTGASSSFSANFVRIFFPPAQSSYDLYENGVSSSHKRITNWTGEIYINNRYYDRYPIYAIIEADNTTTFKPVINGQHYTFDGSFVEYPGAYWQGSVVPKFFKLTPIASGASGVALPIATGTTKLYAMFLVGPMYYNPGAGGPLKYVTEWQVLAYPIESLGIIGDATPGGWGVETQLTKVAPYIYKAAPIRMINNNPYKFRTNNAWPTDAGAFLDLEGTTSEEPLYFWGNGDVNFTKPTGYYNLTIDLTSPIVTQTFDPNIAPTLVNQRIYNIASIKENYPEIIVPAKSVSGIISQIGADFSDARIQVASGIAIVSIPSTSIATVKYRLTSGSSWSTLGSASASSARLLLSTAEIKVIPINGYSGELDVLFKLWDGTDNATNGSVVNTLYAAAGAYTQNYGTLRTAVAPYEPIINGQAAVIYKNNKYYYVGGSSNSINNAHAESINNLDGRYLTKIVGTTSAYAGIDEYGTVFSWGPSANGGGLVRNTDATTPNNLTGIVVKDIVSNDYAFAALDASGYVRTWGTTSTIYGATANTIANIPSGLEAIQFIMITSNKTSFAGIDTIGRVWAWGDSGVGGMSATPTIPTNLSTVNTVKLISKTNGYASIDSSGIIRTWGQVSYGASALSTASTPSLLVGKNIKELYTNLYSYLAIDTSNIVYYWGINGEITYNTIIPKKVIANNYSFAIIDQNDYLYAVGIADKGGIGYFGYFNGNNLTQKVLPNTIKDVFASETAFTAIDFSNNIYAWGNNTAGGIGYNSQEASTPINLSGIQIQQVAGSQIGFAVIDVSSKLWIWGGNTGIYNKQAAYKPVDVNFKKVYSNYLTGTIFAIDMSNNYYLYTNHGSLLDIGSPNSTIHVGLENADISMNSIVGHTEHVIMLDNSNNVYYVSSNSSAATRDRYVAAHINKSDLSVNILNKYTAYNRGPISNIDTFTLLDSNKKLYTWGNYYNALKSGIPTIPENLENVQIAKVCSHTYNTIVLDINGIVYIYGTSTTNGGSGSIRAYTPKSLKNITVVDIARLSSGFAVLDSTGKFYAIGYESTLGGGLILDAIIPSSFINTTFTKMYNMESAVLLQKTDSSLIVYGALAGTTINGSYTHTFSNINTNNIYKIYNNNGTALIIDNSGLVFTIGAATSGGISWQGGVPTNLTGIQFQLDKIYPYQNGFAAIDTSNNLWAWGTSSISYNPANGSQAGIVGTNIVSVVSTKNALATLDTSGVVRAWGLSTDGGAGGTTSVQVTPTGLTGITVSKLYSNDYAFVAVDTSGIARAWGSISYGGINNTTATIPINLTTVQISKIFSNQYAFAAIDIFGTVWAWGSSSYGGSFANAFTAYNPIVYPGVQIKDTTIYSNGFAFAALDTAGRLWSWGYTAYGASATNSARISMTFTNGTPAQVALSQYKYSILDTSGKVYFGGAYVGSYGILSSYPVPMTTLPPIKAVYETPYTSAALDKSGTVWSWGDSFYGGSTNTNKAIPTTPSGFVGINVATVIPSRYAYATIDTSGFVRAWGYSFYGGISTTGGMPTNLAGVQIQKVATNNYVFVAFDMNNIIRVWGDTTYGGINNSTATIPVGLENKSIQQLVYSEYAFAAIDISGILRVWGSPSAGGISSTTATIPTGLENKIIQKVVANQYAFTAIDASGFVYSWGFSSNGARSLTVALPPINLEGKQFIDVAASTGSFSAIDTSGKVWSWGSSIVIQGNTYAGIPANLENVNARQIYSNSNCFVAIDDLSRAYTWGATGLNAITSVATTPTSLVGKQVVSVKDASGFDKFAPIYIKDSTNKLHIVGSQSVIPFSRSEFVNKISGFSTNNAPVLTFTGTLTKPGLNISVSSILSDLSSSYTDSNISDNKGILLTSVDLTNANIYYSTNGGSTYNKINALDGNSLILDANSIIRYEPLGVTNTVFTTSVSYTFKICDMNKLYYNESFGDVGDLIPATYYNNGPVSNNSATLSQTYGINDLQSTPLLSVGPYAVHSVSEDSVDTSGFSVGTLINAVGSNYYQAVPKTKYIAVTGVATGNGTWQYKLVDGSYQTLQNSPSPQGVSTTSALILDASSEIKFIPNANFTGSANITFRAADVSSNVVGTYVNTNVINTGFSAVEGIAQIIVENINDAPVIVNGVYTYGSVSVDIIDSENTGTQVSTIASALGSSFIDIDPAAVKGIAITSIDNSKGTWQYRLSGDAWTDISAVDASNALLLNNASLVRFIPTGIYGDTQFVFKGWDQTTGINGTKVDTVFIPTGSISSNTANARLLLAPILIMKDLSNNTIVRNGALNPGAYYNVSTDFSSDVSDFKLDKLVLTDSVNNTHFAYIFPYANKYVISFASKTIFNTASCTLTATFRYMGIQYTRTITGLTINGSAVPKPYVAWTAQNSTFNTTLNDSFSNRNSQGVTDSQGNIITAYMTQGTVAGGTLQTATDIIVTKVTSTGTTVWTKQMSYSSSSSDSIPSVDVDMNNDVYITWQAPNAGNLYKLAAATGNVLWTTNIRAAYQIYIPQLIYSRIDNTIVVACVSTESDSTGGNYDIFIQKYNTTTGALMWTRSSSLFNSSTKDWLDTGFFTNVYFSNNITIDASGSIIFGLMSGQSSTQIYQRSSIAKIDINGNILWSTNNSILSNNNVNDISGGNGLVTVYSGTNISTDISAALNVGYYNAPAFFNGVIPVGNDNISTIVVPANRKVQLYQNYDFSGTNIVIGEGTYNLESPIVSTTSGSITVPNRVDFVDLTVNNKKLPVTVTNAPFTYTNWSLTFTSDVTLNNGTVINIESPTGLRYHLLYCSGASSGWTTIGTSGSTPSGTLSVNGNTYTLTGGITSYSYSLPNVGGNYSIANNGTDPYKPNTTNFPMAASPNGTWNLIIHNDSNSSIPTISNFTLTFSNNQYNNNVSSLVVYDTDVSNNQLYRNNWITEVKTDASNNIYAALVVGKSIVTTISNDLYDIRIVKLGPNGSIEWAKNYGSVKQEGTPLIRLSPSGTPYITYVTYDVSADKFQGGDFVVEKLSAVNGSSQWKSQNPNINGKFSFFNSYFPYVLTHQMHIDNSENVHLFTMSYNNPPGQNINGRTEQIVYSKLSSNDGIPIWIDTVIDANSYTSSLMKGLIPYSGGIYGIIVSAGSTNKLGGLTALGGNDIRIVNFKESTAVVAPVLSTLASGKTAIQPTLSWVKRNEISTISGDIVNNLQMPIVRVDNSGNSYVIAGVLGGAIPGQTLKNNNELILAKFAPNGTLLWSIQNEISTFGAESNPYLYVEPVSGDIYIATRTSGEFTSSTTYGTTDVAVLKINTNTGARIWLQKTGLSNSTVSENSAILSLTPDKSALIAVYHSYAAVTGGTYVGSGDIVVAKLDILTGAVLTIKQNSTFNTSADEFIITNQNADKLAIKFDISNNFFITTQVGTTDYQLLKFDSSMNIMWKVVTSSFISSTNNPNTNSYVLDSQNNIYWAINIGGSVEAGNAVKGGITDTIIVKISPSGTIVWKKQLEYSQTVDEISVKIAMFNNCLYFAYCTVGTANPSDGIISIEDYVMGRIDINNGSTLWMQRNDLFNSYGYNINSTAFDFTNIMFDNYGNPYIVILAAGSIQKQPALNNTEQYYIKFSALTGEVIYAYNPTAAGSYGYDDYHNFVTYYDGTNMNIFNVYRITSDLSGTVGNYSGGASDLVFAKITESAFSIPVPIMTAGQTTVITSISEDTVEASLPIRTVASIMSDLSYTLTAGSAGMAVTGQNNAGYGTWQYRIDSSSAWIAIASLSTANALLLAPTVELRFLPAAHFHGTVTLTFRLWDCTFGYTGYRTAIIGDAFSLTSATISHVIDPVNDAPFIVSGAIATVTSIYEEIVDASNTGMTVAALISSLSNNYSDADSLLLAPQAAIAITDLSSTIGTWQYTLDGVTWSNISGVTATTALALDGAAKVRLVPNANANGVAEFAFKMWDVTNGVTVGSLTDASVYTASGAFSQNSGIARITVQPVNDAPVLTAGQNVVYNPIIANARDNAGKTVVQILADLSGISDIDSVPPFGIAITGLPDASQSVLQYKAFGSSNWYLIPSASEAAARIFDASDSIRFSPEVFYTGSTSFTFKIWDKGSGTSGGIINTVSVLPGGFSVNTATATLQVTSAPTDISAAITNVFADLSQANVLVTSYIDTQSARPAGDVFSELATQIRDKTPLQRRAVIQALRTALSTRSGPEVSDVSGAKVITISGESSFNNFTQTLAVALPNLAPKPVKVILPDFTSGTPTVVISTLDNTAFIKFELADGEQIMINADGTQVPAIYYDLGQNSYVNISGQNYNAGDFFYIGAKRFRIAGFGSVLVEPVNPPTVVAGLTVVLPPIYDTTIDSANTGKTVASIFTDLSSSYNDLDSGALKGIAITALPDMSQGKFQYKLAGDISWTDVSSAVSMTNALLLDISASVRFVLGSGFLTANNMTFKIWDQTNGSIAGAYANATYVSAGAFSQNTVTATQVVYDLVGIQTIFQIAVSTQDSIENVINALINTNTQTNSALINYIATETSVNAGAISIITQYLNISYTQLAAPALLGSGGVSFGNIYEDIPEASNTGSSIAYLLSQLGSNYSDNNIVQAKGIIITDVTSGTWQYKTTADASWATITLGAGQVLPLDPSGMVRLLPILNFNGTLSFVFKAWNTFSGVAGVPILESALASNSYSTATRVAEINVDARNDAPVVSNTPTVVLSSIAEDVADGSNVGQLVGDIIVGLSGNYSDVDANSLKGIAITAQMVDVGAGAWQYKLAGQSTFTNIGAVSGTSALLLDVSDRIRFVPSANYNGITELTVKGWDQTSGAPSSKVDTAYAFDGAFSAGTATVRLVITPVNDAPILSGTPTYNIPVIAYGAAANTLNGISIAALLTDISNKVVDVDNSYSNIGILLTAADVSGWQYKIAGGNWTAFHTGGADAGKAVPLDASGYVRFIGTGLAGGYTLTYRAWDATIGTVGIKDVVSAFNTSYSSGVGTVFQAVTPDTSQVQTVAVKVSLTGITDSRFVNSPTAVSSITDQLAAVYGVSSSKLSVKFVRVMA